MRASLVISSRNEGKALSRTVRSCLESINGLDCEVLVADDASTDGSVRLVLDSFPGVKVVSHAEQRGVSLTKDLGARSAVGDVLVFLDGHCKPEPGAIARLIHDIECFDGEAVVVPRIASLDVESWRVDLNQVGYGFRVDLDTFQLTWLFPESLRPIHHAKLGTLYRQPTVCGCVMATSRALYDAAWGFDTGMRVYGSEDVDFGVKAWLLGCQVLLDVEPVVGHRFRSLTPGDVMPARHMLANQLRMARKTFTDPVWLDWLARNSVRYSSTLWEAAWAEFLGGYESLERERAYLMANRRYDEFWYASRFGCDWLTATSSGASVTPAIPAQVSQHSPIILVPDSPVFGFTPTPNILHKHIFFEEVVREVVIREEVVLEETADGEVTHEEVFHEELIREEVIREEVVCDFMFTSTPTPTPAPSICLASHELESFSLPVPVDIYRGASVVTASKGRALVAIASYGSHRTELLHQLIDSYRRMAYAVDVVVFTDAPKTLPRGVSQEVGLPNSNPHSLPFAHKALFADERENYDLFLYTEDDILVSEENIDAFMEATEHLDGDEVAGFLRYELDGAGERRFVDAHPPFGWVERHTRKAGPFVFGSFSNHHSGCYLLTREHLRRAVRSGRYLVAPHSTYYGFRETAATDPYTRCGLTRRICLSHLDRFMIRHLVANSDGIHGTEERTLRRQVATLLAERGSLVAGH